MEKTIVDKHGNINGKVWIGVDFDGTLVKRAHWDGKGQGIPGEPVPLMVKRVKKWIKEGKTVKIFTARVSSIYSKKDRIDGIRLIKSWCREHIGQELEVTAEKDGSMIELWDDRAIQVVPDTGITLESMMPRR